MRVIELMLKAGWEIQIKNWPGGPLKAHASLGTASIDVIGGSHFKLDELLEDLEGVYTEQFG